MAADGSVANKVGTYSLAVLAAHHGVPFAVVAPLTTLDPDTPDGAAIVVEQRPAEEVTCWHGRPVAPLGTTAYNPAFDVTPPELITALVTDAGIARPVDAAAIARLLARGAPASPPPSKGARTDPMSAPWGRFGTFR